MKTSTILLYLAVAVVVCMIIIPKSYFEHHGRGGRGGGGYRRGHSSWGRRRGYWGGWGGYGGGSNWGWLYNPPYRPYYIGTANYNNECNLSSLNLYQSCINKGYGKSICTENLIDNLKKC